MKWPIVPPLYGNKPAKDFLIVSSIFLIKWFISHREIFHSTAYRSTSFQEQGQRQGSWIAAASELDAITSLSGQNCFTLPLPSPLSPHNTPLGSHSPPANVWVSLPPLFLSTLPFSHLFLRKTIPMAHAAHHMSLNPSAQSTWYIDTLSRDI